MQDQGAGVTTLESKTAESADEESSVKNENKEKNEQDEESSNDEESGSESSDGPDSACNNNNNSTKTSVKDTNNNSEKKAEQSSTKDKEDKTQVKPKPKEEKNKDGEKKERDRDKDRSKDKSKEKSRDKEKVRDKDKDRLREKREREKEKDKDKDKEKDREKDREKEKDKDKKKRTPSSILVEAQKKSAMRAGSSINLGAELKNPKKVPVKTQSSNRLNARSGSTSSSSGRRDKDGEKADLKLKSKTDEKEKEREKEKEKEREKEKEKEKEREKDKEKESTEKPSKADEGKSTDLSSKDGSAEQGDTKVVYRETKKRLNIKRRLSATTSAVNHTVIKLPELKDSEPRVSKPLPKPIASLGLSKLSLGSLAQAHHPEELQDSRTRIRQYESVCSKILDNLFLGSDTVAKDKTTLDNNGITHVLNCAGGICSEYFPSSFTYKTLFLNDGPSEDISCIFYFVIDYIDTSLKQDGKVFVHCQLGVSRSSAMTICYLMWKNDMSFTQAHSYVKGIRDTSNPNAGFTSQLISWHNRMLQLKKQPEETNKLMRVVPHCSDRPLLLVPKILGQIGFSQLDPRGTFLLQTAQAFYIWIGTEAPEYFVEGAEQIAYLLHKYEFASKEVKVERQGQESQQFLSFMEDNGPIEHRQSYDTQYAWIVKSDAEHPVSIEKW